MFFYEYKAIIVIINTFVAFFYTFVFKTHCNFFFLFVGVPTILIACFIPPYCILHTIKQNNGFNKHFILFDQNWKWKINKSGKFYSTEMNVKPLVRKYPSYIPPL